MNRWMVSAALIAAAGVLYAETVRFDDEPQKMLTVKTRRKEMKTVPLFDGGGRTNFRFAAEFQTFNLNPAGQHCGFLLVGSRRKLHLLTRGDTVNYVPLSGGEEAIGPIAPKLSGTLSNAWTKLELEYRGGFIEISCNRKYVGSIDFDLGELAEVQAYGYRGDLALRSASLEELEAANTAADPAAPPILYAPFDGTADAGPVRVAGSGGVSFEPGLSGQAAVIRTLRNGNSGICFPVRLNPSQGAFSFWFRPDWEGEVRDSMPWYHLLTGQDESGKNAVNIFWWNWLRADFPRRGDLEPVSLARMMRAINHPGDWIHLAFVYDNSGWSTIYVNALPYKIGSTWMDEKPVRIGNFDFGKVKQLLVGSAPETNGLVRAADGAIDEFKVYNRPLTWREVSAEFRRFVPFDLMLDKAAFTTDEEVVLEVAAAPADFYSVPKPDGYDPDEPLAARKLTLKLCDPEEKKVLCRGSFNPVGTTGVQRFALRAGKLPQKLYHLQAEIENPEGVPARRSFPVTVYRPEYERKTAAAGTELKIGARIFTRDLTAPPLSGFLADAPVRQGSSEAGKYTEAGERKGNRFAFEIPFGAMHRRGRPVLLEIEWPDDKPRSMGLYLYVKSDEAMHRDRLEGGIQAGDEYPNSGRMVKTRYLFYPGESRYLFEARTMIDHLPAAVSRVSVYELPEGLPGLAVKMPDGCRPRSFGHLDEDQTVDMTFGYDIESRVRSPFRTGRVADRLAEYMNYTGQNMLSYSLLRYDFCFYPLNNYVGNGLLPYAPGDVPLFLRMLHGSGIDFVSSVNICNLPEFNLQPQNRAALREKGFLLYDYRDEAAESAAPNFFHPEARRLILDHIRRIVGRYGNLPGFRGIDLWGGFTLNAEHGYDNWTAGEFARLRNIALPESMKERYELLNGRYRDEWLKFRADGLTSFLTEVAAVVKAANPALSTVLSVSGEPLRGSYALESGDGIDTAKWYYENSALDLGAAAKIPGFRLAAMRFATDYRWAKHWGKPESTIDEQLYDFERMKPFGPAGVANSYLQYFETFNDSLQPDVFKAYFQNADVKPHGRFFLKELVFNVAAADASRILIGAQPIGTWGRDAEAREFARAYTALPAEPFTLAEGPHDPVTVRYFEAKDGTYFYAASLLWDAGAVTLSLPADTIVTDLSTGESLAVPPDGKLTLPLKAYELRSFFTPGKVAPKVEGAQISERQRQAAAKRLKELDRTLEFLRKAGLASDRAEKKLGEAKRAVGRNEYAEAHRLLFSKLLNGVIRQLPPAENGHLLKRQEMIRASRFAVNCGSGEYDYYVAKDGTLFFPDHPWDGVYGSVSDGSQIGRAIQNIEGTDDPELYATEAYNLDAYRFKVRNGAYTVRVYLKIGYEPNAKEGRGVFTLTVNGRRFLDNFDLFRETGSFNRAIVREMKGIEVTDGMLTLDFTVPDGVHPSVRFLNAIEVIPE